MKSRKRLKPQVRAFIFNRDNFTCKKCGLKPKSIPQNYDGRLTIVISINPFLILELDHIKPFSKGGSDHVSNFQTLCNICNIKKFNRG